MPWDYWQKDGSPKPDTARVIATLESDGVTSRSPGRAPLLHSPDGSVRCLNAESSADRLGSMMPAAGHRSTCRRTSISGRPGPMRLKPTMRAIAADEDYLSQCRRASTLSLLPYNLHFLWAVATLQGGARLRLMSHAGWPKVSITPCAVVDGRFSSDAVARLRAIRTMAGNAHRAEPARDGALRHRHLALRPRPVVHRAKPERARRPSHGTDGVMSHQAFQTTLKDLPLLTNLQIASHRPGRSAARSGRMDEAFDCSKRQSRSRTAFRTTSRPSGISRHGRCSGLC